MQRDTRTHSLVTKPLLGRCSPPLIAALMLTVGQAASAQTTYHVAPCGDDSWTGLSEVCSAPDGPKATIQAAIDAAEDGDTVLLSDGTYAGAGNRDMDYAGRAIAVRSASGDAEACIIDCDGSAGDPHRAFRFHSGETGDSSLQDVTVTDGYMNRGGAILCENGSSPLFSGCIFLGNTAVPEVDYDGGGALHFDASDINIAQCQFLENHVEAADFITTGGGAVQINSSNGSLTGCLFRQNTATGDPSLFGSGAGVYLIGESSPMIASCSFEDNVANNAGAGVRIQRGTGGPLLTDCSFLRNSTLSLARGIGAGFSIGSLPDLHGHPVLLRCRFVDNHSQANGGGFGSFESNATLTDCVFIGNSAAGGGRGGGACVARGDAQVAFTNCLFFDNFAPHGGGGVMVEDNGQAAPRVNIVNCTFNRNRSLVNVAGALRTNGGVTTVSNSILWGNLPNEILVNDGSLNVSYSTVQDGWPGIGNIEGDPLFADDDGDNLRLLAGSPCIDAADNTAVPDGVLTDLDGNPRFHDDPWTPDTGVAGGAFAVVDMGAYEFQGSSCYADFNADGVVDTRDVLAFLNAWNAQDESSDCDGNGTIDTRDVLCFLNLWTASC